MPKRKFYLRAALYMQGLLHTRWRNERAVMCESVVKGNEQRSMPVVSSRASFCARGVIRAG